jgi:aminopeptidase N
LFLAKFNNSRSTESRSYAWNVNDEGERTIKNIALSYLVSANPGQHLNLATSQFDLNHNMTDVRAALTHILDHGDEATMKAKLDAFYQEHQDNPLAINQWFTDQASADRPDVLVQVKALLKHPAYDRKNPNSVRSLVGAFASNTVHFHNKNGSGYRFLADQIIEIDKFNPMLAAGLAKRLAAPHKFDKTRQDLIKGQLERIRDKVKSNNVKEIVVKTLDLLATKQTTTSN